MSRPIFESWQEETGDFSPVGFQEVFSGRRLATICRSAFIYIWPASAALNFYPLWLIYAF